MISPIPAIPLQQRPFATLLQNVLEHALDHRRRLVA
jgi:hypothetical protein